MLAKIKSGIFEGKDGENLVRPAVIDDDLIKTQIKTNPGLNIRDITYIICKFHMNIFKHLKTLGYGNHSDLCMSHDLMEKKKWMKPISIYDSLLKRNNNEAFLKRTIRGDKNGLFTTVRSEINPWQLKKSRSASEEVVAFGYGEVVRALFITSLSTDVEFA